MFETSNLDEIKELQEKGDYNTAISKAEALLYNRDLNEEQQFNLHCILGECYSKLKQNQKAISEYNIALRIDSQSPDAINAFMGLFEVYSSRLQYDEAVDAINKSIKIAETQISDLTLSNEERHDFQEWLGVLQSLPRFLRLYREKRYYELLELCTTKYNNTNETDLLFPLMGTIIGIIGGCLHKLRRYDELLTNIVPHLDDGGDEGLCVSYVGIAHYQKKHYETALLYLDRGINGGNDGDSDTWGYKGECHFILGQYDKAIESYLKSIEVKIPNDDDDFEIAYLEEKIRAAKQKLAQEKSKDVPAHITIQGNSAPINLGGFLATDDAVINRSNMADISKPENTEPAYNLCPQCRVKINPADKFCRKCGTRLK